MKKLKLWHYGVLVIFVAIVAIAVLNLNAEGVHAVIGMEGLQMLSLTADLVMSAGVAMIGLYQRHNHPGICLLIVGFALLIGANAVWNLGMYLVRIFS